MIVQKGNLSLFLENNRGTNISEAAYFYENPIEIISVINPEDIEQGLLKIQEAIDEKYHVAGWISYEAGFCFEKTLKSLFAKKYNYPLIHMGVYEKRRVLNIQDAEDYWQKHHNTTAYDLSDIRLNLNYERYKDAFDKVQGYLNSGDIYQVNFTQKALFDFLGSTRSFFASLRNAQQVEYAAYIESDDLTILSLSPELFVQKKGNKITTKPMKGTIRRGRTVDEDETNVWSLLHSDKERAENLMIVDLLRNDLSKLAIKSSVNVSRLYEIEKYRTLFTMTSTINANLDNKYSAIELLKSIFPCGSVTGAPKIRAQQIIHELEKQERGIYTGAIGYFTPEDDMCFSVPIRTITIDKFGKGELGIGGAIVADSKPENEYNECLLKADFVAKKYPKFDLIEAILWSKETGFQYLNHHLYRLEKSAQYFMFQCHVKSLSDELNEHIKYIKAEKNQSHKIRLLLSKSGNISISSEVIINHDNTLAFTVVVSDEVVDSNDPMLFHKTSLRNFYSEQFQKYNAKTNCFDVLFINERSELTEGSFTNLFIKKDDIYYTPPIECGLLSGIYRQQLLNDDQLKAVEKRLYLDDLKNADQIYLCNAIRGLVPVKLIGF